MRIMTTIFSCLISLVSVTGCSSLLYYPTRVEHVVRQKMPLQPEDVYFQSNDGVRLHGWYFKSPSRQPARCVILQFHGNAQNLSTHFFSLYSAPQKGYDYFIFDYHGYGQSEGTPSPEATVADGHAALRWLKARHPDRPIVVFGQSLGGAVALRTVLDLKNEIPVKLVVVDSTFSSYRSVARSVLAHNWFTWPLQPLGWLLMSDAQAPAKDLHKLSPTPLIVIHGDRDPTVDFTHGERIFELAKEPKEFWRIPGGLHTNFMWTDGGIYAHRFYETLDRHCR